MTAQPLRGTTIAVTRARAQSADLVHRLRDLGARVVEAPVIRIEPIAGPPIDPSAYDLICLTSPNAPALLLHRIGAAPLPAGIEVAAIGPGTAAAMGAVGIVPDLVAERAIAEGLLEALGDRVAGRRVLVARAEEARDALPDGLYQAGAATVDVVPLYRTVAVVPDDAEALTADLVTFTSSSTARSFAGAFASHDLSSVRGVSIGPITSETMREHGIAIAAEAANHDLDGLVAAVLEAAGNR